MASTVTLVLIVKESVQCVGSKFLTLNCTNRAMFSPDMELCVQHGEMAMIDLDSEGGKWAARVQAKGKKGCLCFLGYGSSPDPVPFYFLCQDSCNTHHSH